MPHRCVQLWRVVCVYVYVVISGVIYVMFGVFICVWLCCITLPVCFRCYMV